MTITPPNPDPDATEPEPAGLPAWGEDVDQPEEEPRGEEEEPT